MFLDKINSNSNGKEGGTDQINHEHKTLNGYTNGTDDGKLDNVFKVARKKV